MAIHDAGPYKLVMRESSGARQLSDEGWKVIAQGTTKSDAYNDPVWYWLMAPPEKPEPTLAFDLMRIGLRLVGPERQTIRDVIDALERLTKIEQAARYAVDHQTECGVVERLRNALER